MREVIGTGRSSAITRSEEDVIVSESAIDRKRRLHRVFGDVLPDSTSDDRADQGNEEPDERDQWLRDNRPPHHDPAE